MSALSGWSVALCKFSMSCCTSAQLFYPLLKENIGICNYHCLNYFSIQCFHFLFCVFRGAVIRYIYVYNCYASSDCDFYKSLSLTAVLYFCLIWQRRVEHSVFFMASICTAYFSSSFAITFFVFFDQCVTPIIASYAFSRFHSLHFDGIA